MSTKAAEGKSTSTRSRRELLAGAAGALGVVAMEAVAGGSAAWAHNGDPVILGTVNEESNPTFTFNGSSGGCFSASAAGPGTGVEGTGGATNGTGVVGNGGLTNGTGVLGHGGGTAGLSVFGASAGAIPPAPSKTGAFGYAAQDSASLGVFGRSIAGTGVFGRSEGVVSTGVGGMSTAGGYGVRGTTNGAPGTAAVWGDNAGSGPALKAPAPPGTECSAPRAAIGRECTPPGAGRGPARPCRGRALFSESGLATVLAGTKSVIVTGISLTPSGLVLALVQQSAGGRYVKSAEPDVPNSRFTITLNKAPIVDVAVGWFVVN